MVTGVAPGGAVPTVSTEAKRVTSVAMIQNIKNEQTNKRQVEKDKRSGSKPALQRPAANASISNETDDRDILASFLILVRNKDKETSKEKVVT